MTTLGASPTAGKVTLSAESTASGVIRPKNEPLVRERAREGVFFDGDGKNPATQIGHLWPLTCVNPCLIRKKLS